MLGDALIVAGALSWGIITAGVGALVERAAQCRGASLVGRLRGWLWDDGSAAPVDAAPVDAAPVELDAAALVALLATLPRSRCQPARERLP